MTRWPWRSASHQEVQALCHSPTHLRAEALDRWLLAFGVGNHEVPI